MVIILKEKPLMRVWCREVLRNNPQMRNMLGLPAQRCGERYPQLAPDFSQLCHWLLEVLNTYLLSKSLSESLGSNFCTYQYEEITICPDFGNHFVSRCRL
jgi:hypothetical protein